MTNTKKKISELTPLTSASLNTVVVGVDNGTTYKIELDVLADGVRDRINTLDDSRLSSLEGYTASLVLPNLSSLNTFTSSQNSNNTAFTNGINGRLTTSSFNSFSSSVHNEILAATNEQSFNGLISGSSQLTSSYDQRYTLSGSIVVSPNTISSSAQITSLGFVSSSTPLTSLNTFTASYSTGSFTGSFNGQFNGGFTGSLTGNVFGNAVISNASNNENYSVLFTTAGTNGYLRPYTDSFSKFLYNPSTYRLSLTGSLIVSGSGITGSIAATNGIISGSSQLTSSLATTGSNYFNGNQTVTGSIITTSNIQTTTGYVDTSLLYHGGGIEIRSYYQPLQLNSNGAGVIVNDTTQISGSLSISGSLKSNGLSAVTSSNVNSIQTITSASYAALTPVSGTIYIIIG